MFQNLSSVKIPRSFNGKNKFKVQAWYLVWLFVFRISPHGLNFLRVILLKSFGAKIGAGVKIKPSAFISYPWNVTIGNNSYLGDNVYIDALTDVFIGSNVSVSNGVYLTTGTHDITTSTFDLILKPIKVSDESWLCVRATLLPGCQIGCGSVIGACSLLIENTVVSENEVWAGTPARFIKKRV